MNALIIANTQIRRDPVGRYCLNDLHQASGSESRHKPGNWLLLAKTRELIAEVESKSTSVMPDSSAGNPALEVENQALATVNGGPARGTYAIKELVYAYAMWISPRFHLHVIRAYDAMVTAEPQPPAVPEAPMHRSDVLVSAARGFGALVRAARTMGLATPRAVAAANAATYRATGIDLVNELDAGDVLAGNPLTLVSPADTLQAQVAEWLDGREQVSMADVIAGALGQDPSRRDLQTRLGFILRRLGWSSRRQRVGTDRERLWYPPGAVI